MEKETILEAKGLSKRFALPRKKRKNGEKTFLAVSNLSLSLRRGEIFGLLGPNGAGKTTTLRMLSGLISPSEGEITIFGERLTKDSGHLRAKIGFLTSDLRLDPAFTPDYTFSFFGALYGLSKEQIEAKKKELFHLFGIDDFAFRKIGELSTGMKQKASLAASLLNDPDIVIFDEPTNGLDILAAKTAEDYLSSLREQGKAIIVSTHIFSLIDKLCDHVLIILKGENAYEADMEDIRKTGDVEKAFFSVYHEEEI